MLDISDPGSAGGLIRASEQIVFITGYADVPMSVHVIKADAVDFLRSLSETKPCYARLALWHDASTQLGWIDRNVIQYKTRLAYGAGV